MKDKEKEPSVGAPDPRQEINPAKNNQEDYSTVYEKKQAYMKEANEGRRHMIMWMLKGRNMTARELAYELGFHERNATAPRLTELEQRGLVVVVGTRIDPVTKIRVRVYGRSDEQ